jgi:hypothetical protein
VRDANGPVTFARQRSGIGPERNMPMTLVLLMVFEMSVAIAIGFVLGRIWQIRCDLEKQRGLISVWPRIDAKCSEAVGAIEKIPIHEAMIIVLFGLLIGSVAVVAR